MMNCETQATINEWAERTFGPVEARSAFLRCADEFAELAKALGFEGMAAAIMHEVLALKGAKQMPIPHGTPVAIAGRKESADVLITLYRVAHVLGGDLHADVDDKMVINRARKWRITGDGVGQHVKDGEP